MLMARQLFLRVREDAANALTGAKLPSRRHPRASMYLRNLPIARSKSQKKPTDIGFKRADKYYFLCPFHMEKTPSCVLYPNGHFHCYGCGKSGWRKPLMGKIQERILSGWQIPRWPSEPDSPRIPYVR